MSPFPWWMRQSAISTNTEVDAIGCLMMKHSPYFGVLRRAGLLPRYLSRFNPRDYHPVVEEDPSRFSSAVMRDRKQLALHLG